MIAHAVSPEFAVNYSLAAAALQRQGRIRVDRFKCPAWPETIQEAQADHPVYVHFPLRVGSGQGVPINSETGKPADLGAFRAMMEKTESPWISVHMGPRPADHPDIPPQSTEPAHVTQVGDAIIRDIEALVAEVGPERVVGENIFEYHGLHMRAAVLPEVITRVVETTGCGLLLDISHARLAARDLSGDPWPYIDAMPVHRLREIHVTGIQQFDDRWIAQLESEDVPQARIDELAGKEIDHLPMTPHDWDVLSQAIARIRAGSWACPGIVAFEYGGVGRFFRALTQATLLSEQVPRMYAMVHTLREPKCEQESIYA